MFRGLGFLFVSDENLVSDLIQVKKYAIYFISRVSGVVYLAIV